MSMVRDHCKLELLKVNPSSRAPVSYEKDEISQGLQEIMHLLMSILPKGVSRIWKLQSQGFNLFRARCAPILAFRADIIPPGLVYFLKVRTFT